MIKVLYVPFHFNLLTKMSPPFGIHQCFPSPLCASVSHPLLTAFLLVLFAGGDHPPASVQRGGCSALCPQRGQEHLVCHDTTLAGHLLLDAFHRLPARLPSLCTFLPQRTVGIVVLVPLSHASQKKHPKSGEDNF